MDAMLHALGGILLRAVPTFLLILFLHFYLKSIFFKPLEKVLKARYEATEGARKLAEEGLQRAAAKADEYEKSLFAAQSQIYAAEEKRLKELHERHAAAVAQARAAAEAQIKQASAQLSAEVEQAKRTLDAQSDALAERITDTILGRSAA
jgi:F-type H+-transporting ATPase subunit b